MNTDADHHIGARSEDISRLAKIDAAPTATAKEWFTNTPVIAFFPENRTKILTVEKSDTVATAFKLLTEHKILSLPVFDPKHTQYIGFIDMLDIVCHCLKDFTESELKTNEDFEKLLESHQSLTKYTCGQVAGASGRNQYYPVDEKTSLLAAVDLLLAHRAHRLPVVDSTGQLTSLLSQSSIIMAIARNLGKFSVKDKTVQELGLGMKKVLSVNVNQKALDAFKLMQDNKVLGIAVVDDNGNLVGNISASDLKQIGETHVVARLLIPAGKFVELVPRSEDQLPGPYCVRPSATVEEIFTKVSITRTHRIYVVGDNGNSPVGVISLIDLLEAVRKSL